MTKRRRRKFKRRIKALFILILIITIGITIYFTFGKKFLNNNSKIPETNVNEKTSNKKVKEDVWPKIYKTNLIATGDGLIHNAVYEDAYNKETDSFDFKPQVELVKDIIDKYDLAYYNQETTFGGKEVGYFSHPVFNTPSEYGDAMVDYLGFNIVSLASNHSADCKSKAETCITNSYKYWSNKNVVFDGFNNDKSKENKYNIGKINNITYGFLNYTTTMNGLDNSIKEFEYKLDYLKITNPSENGTCNSGYIYAKEADLCVSKFFYDEVSELRKKVDVLIVAIHGHYSSPEYSTTPSKTNKALAKYLNSLGTDIILGTYSHCLQPYEIIGKSHKTVVFYSLGNFISNQLELNKFDYHPYIGAIGALVNMDITKTLEKDGTSNIKIDNLGADLIFSYNDNHTNYRVVPFSKMKDKYLPHDKAKSLYEEYSGYLTAYDQSIKIAGLSSNT